MINWTSEQQLNVGEGQQNAFSKVNNNNNYSQSSATSNMKNKNFMYQNATHTQSNVNTKTDGASNHTLTMGRPPRVHQQRPVTTDSNARIFQNQNRQIDTSISTKEIYKNTMYQNQNHQDSSTQHTIAT